MLLAVPAHLVVGEVRMDLDLVDRGHRAGLVGQPLQMGDLKVGHADAAGAAVFGELLQRLPRRHVVAVVERGQWPVDEEQIDVVESQGGQRLVERPAGVVGCVEPVVELAGDVHLGPVDTGIPDTLTDTLLVAVHLRGIDVAVADVQRRLHRCRGLLGRDLEHTEAQLGDLGSVVQFDRGYLSDSSHSMLTLPSFVNADSVPNGQWPQTPPRVVHSPRRTTAM